MLIAVHIELTGDAPRMRKGGRRCVLRCDPGALKRSAAMHDDG
jgi:hypothetical protein